MDSGPGLPNFKSSFFDNYVRLGFIYQKNLIEDPQQTVVFTFDFQVQWSPTKSRK